MISNLLNENVVLIIGNGINRHHQTKSFKDELSWEKILLNISKEIKHEIKYIPEQFPFTEIFDVFTANTSLNNHDLKKIFAKNLESLESSNIHKKLINLCVQNKTDIITTNFDSTLELAYDYKNFKEPNKKGFTRYYPWQIYYSGGNNEKNEIKIWHIQGDSRYPDSLRITVKDYIDSSNQFKKYNPLNKKSKYYSTSTCFNSFFEKKLIFIGVALNEQEFFLRSLLYKKRKYNSDKILGWYIYCKEDSTLFKDNEKTANFVRLEYFMHAVGITLIEEKTWDTMYDFELKLTK